MGKTSKDKRDIYYRLAKEEGWRARSAFKLLQLDDEFGLLRGVERVVDLCAAPGSWSQVLSKRLFLRQQSDESRARVKIVAVDLQPMSPLPGVIQLQGDITELRTAEEIISHFEGGKANLVICDGAPDVTGLHSFDEYLQSQLVYAAFNITSMILEEGGVFVSKIFRAKEVSLLYAQMKLFFEEVHCCKPKSSRQSSCESFIVCRGYSPPEGYQPTLENPFQQSVGVEEAIENLTGANRTHVPFMACGDLSGFDADRSYSLDLSTIAEDFKDWTYEYTEVVQLPTQPAYKKACKLKKMNKLTRIERSAELSTSSNSRTGSDEVPSVDTTDRGNREDPGGGYGDCVDGMGSLFI